MERHRFKFRGRSSNLFTTLLQIRHVLLRLILSAAQVLEFRGAYRGAMPRHPMDGKIPVRTDERQERIVEDQQGKENTNPGTQWAHLNVQPQALASLHLVIIQQSLDGSK